MAHDIFISYATENKPIADAVCAALEAQRIRCWIAPRDILPSDSYGSSIIEAIETSRLLILIFSAHSNRSPQVMREVERAVAKGLLILPFRIEDVRLSPDMEYFISAPHWLDALTQPLEGHLAHLAETARLLLSRMGAAPADAGRSHGEPARDRTTPIPGHEEGGRTSGKPARDRTTSRRGREEDGRAIREPEGAALPGRKVLRTAPLAGWVVSVALVVLFGSWLAHSRLLSAWGATAIDRCPITLDRPGRYAVSRDLACSGTGITITSGNVSLDLGGHTLRGSGTKPDAAPGIRVQAVAHVAIRNGTIIGFGGGGIVLEGTRASEVADIKATGNRGASVGIFVNGASGVRISGNTLQQFDQGIVMVNASNNNNITRNAMINNRVGMDMNEGSNNNAANGNTASNNSLGGIVSQNDSNSNSIGDNTANNNGQFGIAVLRANRNTVRANRMSGNQGQGILIAGRDNRIEQNTAVENGQNDLQDDNSDPGNTWTNNVFRTRNRPYIQ